MVLILLNQFVPNNYSSGINYLNYNARFAENIIQIPPKKYIFIHIYSAVENWSKKYIRIKVLALKCSNVKLGSRYFFNENNTLHLHILHHMIHLLLRNAPPSHTQRFRVKKDYSFLKSYFYPTVFSTFELCIFLNDFKLIIFKYIVNKNNFIQTKDKVL